MANIEEERTEPRTSASHRESLLSIYKLRHSQKYDINNIRNNGGFTTRRSAQSSAVHHFLGLNNKGMQEKYEKISSWA